MKIKNWIIRSAALSLSLMLLVSGFSGCNYFQKEVETVVPVKEKYDATDRIERALDQLLENPFEQAELLKGVAAKDKVLALNFESFASEAAISKVLTLLEEYQVEATFFLTGIEAAENEKLIKKIAQSEHAIGSGTLYGKTRMEEMKARELVEDFARVGIILEKIIGEAPTLLKCRATDYGDKVLSAASAAGYDHVVESDRFVSYQSFPNYEAAQGFVSKLRKGDILSVKLSGVLGEEEYEASSATQDAYMPGERQPGIKDGETAVQLGEEERMLQAVEWLLKAAKEAGWQIVPLRDLATQSTYALDPDERQAQYLGYRENNNGRLAGEIRMAYTTQRAAALSFYGIGNQEAVNAVLAELERLKIQSTFYVTESEIDAYPDTIRKIIDLGCELGVAIVPKSGMEYLEACEQIFLVQDLLRTEYGISVKLASQISGAVSKEVMEAVSAMGLRLASYTSLVNTSGDKGGASAIVSGLLGSSGNAVKRGEIFYFRLDTPQKSNNLAAEVIRLLYQRAISAAYTAGGIAYGSGYTFRGVDKLINASSYWYPMPSSSVIYERRNQIYAGHLRGLSPEDILSYTADRYIGNPDITTVDQLPGYTEKEVARLDKSGKLDMGYSNTVFLTFDDWGTDQVLNQLLDVLKKHNVKATFFIRSEYVGANPNLLRAIGEQGHAIGCHTHRHLSLASYVEGSKYTSISPEEVKALKQDVARSYKTLSDVVGDLRNEKGHPVLTRLFRPPTLAVSREGMEAIFDSGFTYIVNGDFSTGDYKSTSADQLFDLLVNGEKLAWQEQPRKISGGSIVVMHMSDNAKYTPEALDKFFTWNAKQSPEQRYTFARLSDYIQ